MRKIVVGTLFFILLTLSITQVAEAQHVWKQNTITNRTNETIYVAWSTAYPAFGSVPVAGYRTSGWTDIPAGQQRSYWAYSTHRIYFLILKGGDAIKPTTSTDTYSARINRNAHFDIVTEGEIHRPSEISYSNTKLGDTTLHDGFLRYANGSSINVTNAWVDVDTRVSLRDAHLVGNTVTNALPVTLYVTFAAWQPADGDVREEGYRTSGYHPIAPGSSRTFHGADGAPIFFRFQRLDRDTPKGSGRMYLSPAADTPTVSSWVAAEDDPVEGDGEDLGFSLPITNYESLTYKSFNIVTPTNVVFGTAERGQIKFTDVPERRLEKEDGFIEYPNGSHITVTGEWIFRWVFEFYGWYGYDPGDPVLDDRGNPVRADATDDLPDPPGDSTDAGLGDANGDGGMNGGIAPDDMADDSTIPDEESITGPAVDDGSSDLPVSIPNVNLRTAIALALGKKVGNISTPPGTFILGGPRVHNASISRKEMQTLTKLEHSSAIQGTNISDFTGLEFATNLRILHITDNQISDISPLKGLVKLEQLNLSGNRLLNAPANWLNGGATKVNNISDVSVLKDLVNLRTLNLANNSISDVSALKGLVNLRTLNLANNSRISDVSALKDLVELRELDLSGNNISDVSPLKNLVNLETLRLDKNNISDVSPLKNLVNLETLRLANNPVRNADVLSQWTLKWSLETSPLGEIAFAGRNSDTFFFVNNRNEILKARIVGESVVFEDSVKVNSNIINLRIPQENPSFVAILKENEYVDMYYTSDLTPRGASFEGSRGEHEDKVFSMDVSGNGKRLVVYGSDWKKGGVFSSNVTKHILWKFDVSAPQTRFYSGDVISEAKGRVIAPTYVETIAVDFDGKYVYYTGRNGVYNHQGTLYAASEERHGATGGFHPINPEVFESDVIAYDYPYMVAGYWKPGGKGKIIVWDVVNNVPYRTLNIPGQTFSIAINGDIVAAVAGNVISVFNMATVTQEEISLDVPATHIAIGGGGDYIAVSGTRWNLEDNTISGGLSILKRSVVGAPAAPALEQPLVETRLGTNYPNPFNPETWIPYNLSQPAEVALTIYAVDGKVVRHLDLGHQVAGFYQSKSRAAHWDGRNAIGERVASGVYFYTLTAGDFTATRKMLILK